MNPLASAALESLAPLQISFLQNLPKAELHAHLNGSIPLDVLRALASTYKPTSSASLEADTVSAGIERLQNLELKEIHDFFGLFPAIYALTSTPETLAVATRAVLSSFLPEQCTYIELRTTPRETASMSREDYVRVVLDEVEKYPKERAALILSLDRRMTDEVMWEVVRLATKMKSEGRRVVGVDLCGDPTARDVNDFAPVFKAVKDAGLGLTVHIAETKANTPAETMTLLSYHPNRLGHATFLESDEARAIVEKEDMCVEICLSSNILCKSVPTLQDHHVRHWLNKDHPVVICTDDCLPFQTTLLGEYALLLAAPPLGLGMSEDEVTLVAEGGLKRAFRT